MAQAEASSELEFAKFVATGNDFLFIDARTASRDDARNAFPVKFAHVSRGKLTKKLCDRHWGAGADGLVFVESSEKRGRLRWDFYNADGSAAEMCGNASRCMGRWAKWRLGLNEVEFDTVVGPIRVVVGAQDDDVASHFESLQIGIQQLQYRVGHTLKTAQLINTGVPHAVCTVDSLSLAKTAVDDIRALRFHPALGPEGANVTFLQVLGPKRFSTVTFERGIENFTLSCGTGVMAAAAVGLRAAGNELHATVETSGGTISVDFGKDGRGAVLAGPARFLYRAAVGEGLLDD